MSSLCQNIYSSDTSNDMSMDEVDREVDRNHHICDKLYPQMTPGHINYDTSMKEILCSAIINHQRLKFNDELLFAVFKHAKTAFEAESVDIWQKNELTRLAFDFLNVQLRLCNVLNVM